MDREKEKSAFFVHFTDNMRENQRKHLVSMFVMLFGERFEEYHSNLMLVDTTEVRNMSRFYDIIDIYP